jgi:metal-sulfur cluster biosynthetic enzyme
MAKESEVRNVLAQVQDPELEQNIVDLGMVRDIHVTDGSVAFTLALTSLSCPFGDSRSMGFIRTKTASGTSFAMS